ncbi:MAG: ABC transporter substrate-binding protein [Desulfobacteraceae bacterium]|jgi:branched-chain amino acid transport system substrate-binding protein
MKRSFLILLISLIIFFLLPYQAIGEDYINIGVVGPMKYNHGKDIWNGAMMAADEINRRGGVRIGQRRMKIELIKIDTNETMNVENATNMMEMLCFQNRVDFVVGGFRSEAVLFMQDVAMDYKKIYISIGAALPELCQRVAQNYTRYKYYFRGGTFNSYYLGKGCFLQLDYAIKELRKQLGIKTIKVAIAAEESNWVDTLIEEAKKNFPQMGIELVGVFRSSPTSTNVSREIRAIAKTKAPIVFTLFSSGVGITFVSQVADFQLPVLMTGINLEAQRSSFWESTGGKAQYVMSVGSFCPGVEASRLTKPFVKNYMKRYGEIPAITADSYSAIAFTLIPAIEQAGSIDPDLLVNVIENREYETPLGITSYEKDKLGRQLHEPKFGVDYSLTIGIQWIDGQMKGIWPNRYLERPGVMPLTYKGIVNMKIPPLVLETYKKY